MTPDEAASCSLGPVGSSITGTFTAEDRQILDALLTASGRPVTWLTVMISTHKEVLAKAEPLIKRGAIPQVSAVPVIRNIDLRTPGGFAALPAFRVFNKPVEEMRTVYADASFRAAFRHDLNLKLARPDLTRTRVEEVSNPELKRFEGRSLPDIGAETGRGPRRCVFGYRRRRRTPYPLHDHACA